MKTTRILFLTLCLSLSVFILEAQNIFPYPADSSERLVGKYLPTNPNPNYEVSKKQGSAKLIDSVDYFGLVALFDSISGRTIPTFKLLSTDKYNEHGNPQELYYYSYKQPIRSRYLGGKLTWNSEGRIIQSLYFSGSCFLNIIFYAYDTDGNLTQIRNYVSKTGMECIDTTQKTFIISQYEYTYNNVGKKTSETKYIDRQDGFPSAKSRIEYKYVNDSLLSFEYNSNYNEYEKRWEYTDKTQTVYDSTGLLQKEIYFANHLLDSVWLRGDSARYNYTFNEKGQMESMKCTKEYGYNERRFTYYPSDVIDSIVEKNVDYISANNNYTITSKYNEDSYIKYKDQIFNNSSRNRKRWEYHYVGDVVISGIDEKTNNSRLILYPNPAVQQITIALNPEEPGNIVRKTEILNLGGQTVWTDNSSYLQKTIDLSALRPGTYFIRLTTSNGIISKKLFKM